MSTQDRIMLFLVSCVLTMVSIILGYISLRPRICDRLKREALFASNILINKLSSQDTTNDRTIITTKVNGLLPFIIKLNIYITDFFISLAIIFSLHGFYSHFVNKDFDKGIKLIYLSGIFVLISLIVITFEFRCAYIKGLIVYNSEN